MSLAEDPSSTSDFPAVGDDVRAEDSPQDHGDIVLARTWWWAVHLSLSAVALVANLIFIITVIYNR